MTSDQTSSDAPTASPEPGRPRRPGTLSRVALLAIALVVVFATHSGPGSWADASRLAAIESLAERGTLAIDDSTYFWQGDKVFFEPHYYSHQPPMLGLIGALPYAVLHHLGGLGIDSGSTYRVLTLLLTGLPVLAGLWALVVLARRAGASDAVAAGCALVAGVATILLPYTVVLNQHGTAAGLVLLAFLAVDSRRYATAGALLSLAATIDMSAVFPALACILPVCKGGGIQGFVRYVAAALPPLALHLGVNLSVAGDVVPFSLHREAFEYPMSPFLLSSLTGVDQPLFGLERAEYLFGSTFGASGLFSHHPILLAALLAGAALLLGRKAGSDPRLAPGLLLAALLSSAGVAGFYLFSSLNYSGSAFGMRWFSVFAPLLLLFPAALDGRRRDEGRTLLGSNAARAVVGLLFLWSTAAACLGAVNPWSKFHYRWIDSPQGRVAEVGTAPPAPLEHWEAEWNRIQARPEFDRAYYDWTYQRMIDQHRRFYLRATPWLDEDGRDAWLREGLVKLHRVVDPLDSDRTPVEARPVGHFWLGKFYVELGDRVAAEREFQAAATLSPQWLAPRQALKQLTRPEDG